MLTLTREVIVKTLAQERDQLLAHYRAFTPHELEESCTKSEAPDGERSKAARLIAV